MNSLRYFYDQNKKILYFSIAVVFFWGLIAHGYCFLDNNFSHDSRNEFHAAMIDGVLVVKLGDRLY